MHIYGCQGEYAQATFMAKDEAAVKAYMVEHGRVGYPWTSSSIYFDTDPEVEDLDYCIYLIMEEVLPLNEVLWDCIELSSYME